MSERDPSECDARGPSTFSAVAAHVVARVVFEDETAEHVGFVDALSSACSPLAGLMPAVLVHQQSVFQRIGQEAAFPHAMRLVAKIDDQPIGRVAIHWGIERSRCVDIAVLPMMQGRGIGTDILTAWLLTARRLQVPTGLSVRYDSPAIPLYERLGFVRVGNADAPMLEMTR